MVSETAIIDYIVQFKKYTRKSNSDLFEVYSAIALYNYVNNTQSRPLYYYMVDFGLDNTAKRGYVFCLGDYNPKNFFLLDGAPFTVAHGSGSGQGIPKIFLNSSPKEKSHTTSLGLYVTTGSQMSFSGHYKLKGKSTEYTSIKVHLRGMSGSFNNQATARGIVIHGAPYVTENRAGNSQGCPAITMNLANKLIPILAGEGKTAVFLFSPNDLNWVNREPWVHDKTSGLLPTILQKLSNPSSQPTSQRGQSM